MPLISPQNLLNNNYKVATTSSNMNSAFTSIQCTIPTGFTEILTNLNREILRDNPTDIYQYCANYFNLQLSKQRESLLKSALPEQPNTMHQGNQTPSSLSQATKVPITSSTNTSSNQNEENTVAYPCEEINIDDDDNDDDDDEEDDVLDEKESPNHSLMPININRNRRTSVSAESMAPSVGEAYVKIDIPKSDEQRTRIQTSIRSNFLFKSLDEEQYTDVVNAMAEKKVVPGEEIIKQGGVGDFFYVAESGSFDVYVSKNGNPAQKVFHYEPGGSFGELALMYNAPRAATVICVQEGVLWALDRVTFRRILMENTSRKRRMYENFLEEVPILKSLEPYERHKIADALESITFNEGETIIQQGDVGDNFYIIETGEARVKQIDENGVEHDLPGLMKKGDYFGELALLTDKPRKATIIAKGKVKLATLGKKAFVRLLGPVVDILKRNVPHYQSYVKITLD